MSATGPFVQRLALVACLVALWELVVRLGSIPAFVLAPPSRVMLAFSAEPGYFLGHAAITGAEIIAGLAFGATLGAATAVGLGLLPRMERLVGPLLAASQALPVFAIAPLLVIWFGFGVASKVVMASLIIYFPVTTAFADGLRRTDIDLVDLARLNGAGRWKTMRLVRIPAALPSLCSGLRVAASVAPIGAVVGEWVGASAGLGFIMLQANARMQTDRVFVALVILAAMAVILRLAVDAAVRQVLFWIPGESLSRK